MNPNDSQPLFQQTLRAIALMLVPVIAFLAILSAVALFAVPSSNPSAKDDHAAAPEKTADQAGGPTAPNAGPRIPGARALKSTAPNKI